MTTPSATTPLSSTGTVGNSPRGMPISTTCAGMVTWTASPSRPTALASVTGQVGSRLVGSAQVRAGSSVMSAQQSAAVGPQASLLK